VKLEESISKIKKLLTRSPDRIGIDLEGGTLKYVKFSRHAGSLVLEAYGLIDINFKEASDEEKEQVKLFLKEICGKSKSCGIALEHDSLRVRRMSLADMPDFDLQEAIRWNFREHIECSIDDYQVGHSPIPEFSQEGKKALMAYGVSNEAVKEYSEYAKSLGLKLVSLEPVVSALGSILNANNLLSDDKHTVSLFIGEDTAYFTVLSQQSALFSRPLTNSSIKSLVSLFAQQLGVGGQQAIVKVGEILREQTLALHRGVPFALDSANETLMKQFRSQLVIETQRSIDAFCIMYGLDKIDEIYVCGLGVAVPGLVEQLNHALGVATKIFDPFEHIPAVEDFDNTLQHRRFEFSIAAGMAVP